MNSRTNKGVTQYDAVTTSETEQPAIKHSSLFKTKLFGAVLALAGSGFLYQSTFCPLAAARRARLHYLNFDLRSIFLLYLGIWLLMVDLRDQTIMEVGPAGRQRLKRKGRIALLCFCSGFAITCIAAYLYLRP